MDTQVGILYNYGEILGNSMFVKEVFFDRKPKQRRVAVFQCQCGNFFESDIASIKSSHTKGCKDCLIEGRRKRATKHGHGGLNKSSKKSETYRTWSDMKSRCYNPNNIQYKDYGGRGITICDRWLNSFLYFLEDMGTKPKGFSIERVDVNGNYEQKNCKWLPFEEQVHNRRKTVFVVHNGIKKPLSVVAKEFGIERRTLYTRVIQDKMDIEKALSLPVRKTKRKKGNIVTYQK